MKKVKAIALSLVLTCTVNLNAYDLTGEAQAIQDTVNDLSGQANDLTNSLNGFINGFLGPDFYSNLDIGQEIFGKFGEYSKEVNQLLGILGITGNINCFVDLNGINTTINSIKLDRICKVDVNNGGLDWGKTFSGKIDIPGIGSIGCDADVAINPVKSIDLCSLAKKSIPVLINPNDPNSGFLAGGGIEINPARTLASSATTDSMLRTESNFAEVSDPANISYENGATLKKLKNALDVDNIFADENSANSPLAETISQDKPEEYALLIEYAKSVEAKKNAKDGNANGGGWDNSPTEKQITQEAVKARPDYFSLPENNEAAEMNIASMADLLAQEFPYTDFAKSLEIYLGVEYGKINEDGSVVSVPQAKELETKVFNEFIQEDVQIESKAVIESIDGYMYTAIEKVASSSGRLTAPTQQRLDKLPPSKKLAYIALANKQYTRDALIASISSRITQFKKRLFDLKVEKTRVCSSRFYDNVADAELNKIINSADALVY